MVSTRLKNISQNGNLPQIGMKKKYLKPPPRLIRGKLTQQKRIAIWWQGTLKPEHISGWIWTHFTNLHLGVSSKNRGGPPKSSILIGFSIINHPFWGTPIFGNTHFLKQITFCQHPSIPKLLFGVVNYIQHRKNNPPKWSLKCAFLYSSPNPTSPTMNHHH